MGFGNRRSHKYFIPVNAIDVGKASSITGAKLYMIVRLADSGWLFHMSDESGRMFISRAVLPELRNITRIYEKQYREGQAGQETIQKEAQT